MTVTSPSINGKRIKHLLIQLSLNLHCWDEDCSVEWLINRHTCPQSPTATPSKPSWNPLMRSHNNKSSAHDLWPPFYMKWNGNESERMPCRRRNQIFCQKRWQLMTLMSSLGAERMVAALAVMRKDSCNDDRDFVWQRWFECFFKRWEKKSVGACVFNSICPYLCKCVCPAAASWGEGRHRRRSGWS